MSQRLQDVSERPFNVSQLHRNVDINSVRNEQHEKVTYSTIGDLILHLCHILPFHPPSSTILTGLVPRANQG